jgi:hypothetical protein
MDKMNRIALLALAIVFGFCGLPVRAQDDGMPSRAPEEGVAARAQAGDAPEDSFTAGKLKDACAPAAGLDKNARALADQTCQSYLRGLTEGLFLQQYVQRSGATVCLPDDGPIPVEDAKAAVLNYLAQNPDAANREAGAAAILAIVRTHSCGGD